METMRIEIKHENGSRFTAELSDSAIATEMISMFADLLLMVGYHPESVKKALEATISR